jgi:ATP-binding cassette subfamily G (WHITE) protein 2 (SNQ2)
MLDVIGAGATAVSDRDWHEEWLKSAGSRELKADIDRIHSEGRSRPPVAATLQSEFATSWTHQTRYLIVRGFQSYWRDPTYLMAKLRYFLQLFLA